MPKTFADLPEVTNVLTTDIYPLERDGADKRISGNNLMSQISALITGAIVGKFGVDDTINALVGGVAGCLDNVPTTGLPDDFRLIFAIEDRLRVFQLQAGLGTGDDVIPLDNPTSKRWRSQL